jgi:hypothetical protein
MFAIVQKIRTLRLFQRAENLETSWQIILWWELRRIPYNLIVGATGFFACLILFGIAFFSERKFGEAIGLPDSPLFGIMAIFLYGIGANICYTAGWILELFAKNIWKKPIKDFAPAAFAIGTFFSVVLNFAPVIVCFIVVAVKLLKVHS